MAMLRGSLSVPGPVPFVPHAPRNSISGVAGFSWNALVVEPEQPVMKTAQDAMVAKSRAEAVARMNRSAALRFRGRLGNDVTCANAANGSLMQRVGAFLARFFVAKRGEMKYWIAFSGGLIDGDWKISAKIAFDVCGFVTRAAATPGVNADQTEIARLTFAAGCARNKILCAIALRSLHAIQHEPRYGMNSGGSGVIAQRARQT